MGEEEPGFLFREISSFYFHHSPKGRLPKPVLLKPTVDQPSATIRKTEGQAHVRHSV